MNIPVTGIMTYSRLIEAVTRILKDSRLIVAVK
jgi:hypothetical protein